jgi:hypothetical protein
LASQIRDARASGEAGDLCHHNIVMPNNRGHRATRKVLIMSTTWNLAFVVPTTTPSGVVRKFTFEDTDGNRATLLGGPWAKSTLIGRGMIDGVAITTAVPLAVVLKQSEHGPVLVTQGARLSIVDPVVTIVPGKLGADGKPLRNLSGGTLHLTTYAMMSGDDDPALAGGSFAQVSAAEDDPALA